MSRAKLPNSIRKFLRRQKADLRRRIWDKEEAENKIRELVADVFKRHLRVGGKGRAV